MNLLQKLKETISSVLPIMAIVLILGLTIAPLGSDLLVRFILGGVLLILGLTVFLLGVDIGILPIGERSGAALTAKRSLPLLLGVSFAIGFMVTVAEPDVQVLAGQIKNVSPAVNKWALIFMIAAGIGLFVVIGLLRTMLSLKLKYILLLSYAAVFAMAFFCPSEFQGIAFDAGGATTGPMTVPFIMALGVGVAAVRSKGQIHSGAALEKSKNSTENSSDDSFGLTGIASVGPVAAVCFYGILQNFTNSNPSLAKDAFLAAESSGKGSATGLYVFLSELPSVFKEVSMALLPLVAMFIVFQIFLLKMPPFQVRRMIKGLLYSFAGLVLFLTGVNGGFMPAGQSLGGLLGKAASTEGGWWLLLLCGTGTLFGAVVVCAEPAVWVLTEQVESISGGTIKRKVMLAALSAGVAVSIGLSMLRLLFSFSIWYILLPGYALALFLSFICPPLFTAIAFDSGGVASGPMTSTFILSFTLGASLACGGNPVTDAFGVIALVAMTPLIAIQVLGIIFRLKQRRARTK
ncbi:MAG TPA: DUF1538 domain-containing protein [Treponema sp.]|nr:DUF1538 domain-containing protein [Treponema sp.]